MSEVIKLIDETTDIKSLNMREVDFDLVIERIPYVVVCIDGYVHSIGGRWGDNAYWAYPAGEEPTYENLIQFDTDPCSWGIKINHYNKIKSKWNVTYVRGSYCVAIERNNENFYIFYCNDLDFGLNKARGILFKIQDGFPINFDSKHWQEEMFAKKIFYREQPAKIIRWQYGNVYIVPDGIEKFQTPSFLKDADNDWAEDHGSGCWVDIFSENISWYRS